MVNFMTATAEPEGSAAPSAFLRTKYVAPGALCGMRFSGTDRSSSRASSSSSIEDRSSSISTFSSTCKAAAASSARFSCKGRINALHTMFTTPCFEMALAQRHSRLCRPALKLGLSKDWCCTPDSLLQQPRVAELGEGRLKARWACTLCLDKLQGGLAHSKLHVRKDLSLQRVRPALGEHEQLTKYSRFPDAWLGTGAAFAQRSGFLGVKDETMSAFCQDKARVLTPVWHTTAQTLADRARTCSVMVLVQLNCSSTWCRKMCLMQTTTYSVSSSDSGTALQLLKRGPSAANCGICSACLPNSSASVGTALGGTRVSTFLPFLLHSQTRVASDGESHGAGPLRAAAHSKKQQKHARHTRAAIARRLKLLKLTGGVILRRR